MIISNTTQQLTALIKLFLHQKIILQWFAPINAAIQYFAMFAAQLNVGQSIRTPAYLSDSVVFYFALNDWQCSSSQHVLIEMMRILLIAIFFLLLRKNR
mmetsp:Transcript_10183/g.22051  ORF Transcript_10183/g.22051 Transcript_10183/m.22051 type:complete len:99 (-) Transcript_10183:352-648(-)